MSTNRLEAFSDGVIAVAITLLVLDIHVPAPSASSSLAHQLAQMWPNYVAYFTSFITIGIIWINHHVMISRLAEADHLVLVLNLLLLLSIAVLPFATSLMSTYLRESSGQHLAAAVYSGAFLVMSIVFTLLNRRILLVKPQLMVTELPQARRRQIWLRSASGLIPYVVATAVAPLSSYATLAICGAVAVFYALPVAGGRVKEA